MFAVISAALLDRSKTTFSMAITVFYPIKKICKNQSQRVGVLCLPTNDFISSVREISDIWSGNDKPKRNLQQFKYNQTFFGKAAGNEGHAIVSQQVTF